MQKPTQKRKLAKEPQAEEDFGVGYSDLEIMQELYEDLEDINESLIDDVCYATERIEKLENGFIKGLFVGGVIVGIVWLISL